LSAYTQKRGDQKKEMVQERGERNNEQTLLGGKKGGNKT